MSALFGKKKTPEQLTKEWIKTLREQQRKTKRERKDAENALTTEKNRLKQAAKQVNGDPGRMAALKIQAKTVVTRKKTVAHLYGVETQINSAILQIKEQQATIKMTKAMATSTQVTALMNRLVSIPDIQATTQKMAMEMEKHGLISEMVDEAFDDLNDDMEEQVDETVEAVIMEVTKMNLDQIGQIKNNNLGGQQQEIDDDIEEDDEKMKEMKARMKALSS